MSEHVETQDDPIARFNYQFLRRLQQDCDYYLGWGARRKKHLWALDEAAQIQKMKEVYNLLPEKPEWLSMRDILAYEAAMLPPKEGNLQEVLLAETALLASRKPE